MICPNCNHKIVTMNKLTEGIKLKISRLAKEGYSMRDISQVLEFKISPATICRFLKSSGFKKEWVKK